MKKLSAAQEKALEVIKTGKVTWKRGLPGKFAESFEPEKGPDLSQRTVNCLIDRGLCRINRADNFANEAPVIYTGKDAGKDTEKNARPEATMKYRLKTTINNETSTTFIRETDAQHITSRPTLNAAKKKATARGYEIKITDTMTIVVISE